MRLRPAAVAAGRSGPVAVSSAGRDRGTGEADREDCDVPPLRPTPGTVPGTGHVMTEPETTEPAEEWFAVSYEYVLPSESIGDALTDVNRYHVAGIGVERLKGKPDHVSLRRTPPPSVFRLRIAQALGSVAFALAWAVVCLVMLPGTGPVFAVALGSGAVLAGTVGAAVGERIRYGKRER